MFGYIISLISFFSTKLQTPWKNSKILHSVYTEQAHIYELINFQVKQKIKEFF